MSHDDYADEEMEPDPALNRMTNAIIGAAIEVHRRLGPGHLESAHQAALAIEFTLRQIPHRREHPVALDYKGHVVGQSRLDFLVYDQIIVETKAVETVPPIQFAIVTSYLRITGLKLAIVINFHVRRLTEGIRRIAN